MQVLDQNRVVAQYWGLSSCGTSSQLPALLNTLRNMLIRFYLSYLIIDCIHLQTITTRDPVFIITTGTIYSCFIFVLLKGVEVHCH